jgi:hypothetical protein
VIPNLEDIVKEQISTATTTTTSLVRRGNYANPCMTILTMDNVYIGMTHFAISGILQILWLDGHAHGDLDAVWRNICFKRHPSISNNITIRTTINNSSSSLSKMPLS